MSLFSALDISGSGIDADQTWIDTTGGNIANAEDVGPTSQGAYMTQTPVFSPEAIAGTTAEGVDVSSVTLGSSSGEVVHDPGNPLADSQGDVRESTVDLASQMVDLVQAQQAYEANAHVFETALTAYKSALTLNP